MTKPAAIKIEPWGAQIEAWREIGRLFYSRGWSEAGHRPDRRAGSWPLTSWNGSHSSPANLSEVE